MCHLHINAGFEPESVLPGSISSAPADSDDDLAMTGKVRRALQFRHLRYLLEVIIV